MTAERRRNQTITAIRLDLAAATILTWVARVSAGTEGELTADAHIYFFDRYQKLADHHRQRGHLARAHKLQAKADEHYRLGGGEGPPYAAAMGMPRPRPWFSIDAVSRRLGGPDETA